MLPGGFISEIIYYKRISLGNREEDFLRILAHHDQSAWDITRSLEEAKERVAYKNVRETLIRLRVLGLIKESKKRSESKHNAKRYEITSRGIFQWLLSRDALPYHLNLHRNDIIIRNILYRFFEPSSIRKFGRVSRVFALRLYLAKCCEAILKKLELLRSLGRLQDLEFRDPESYDLEYVSSEIEESITIEIKNFVYQIIIGSKIKDSQTLYDYSHPILMTEKYEEDEEENENGPNYRTLFPKPALMADEKFLEVLRKMKKEFDNGCREYLTQ